MEDKMRERMIVAFDQAVRIAGASSFEEGMGQARMLTGLVIGWVHFVNNFIQPIQTVVDLRETLVSRMSLTESEETLLLLALENLPQIVREGFTMVAEKAKSTLPPPHGGRRPAFTAEESQKVLDYVSHLNRMGAEMPIAKDRAAQRFGCSRRTIDRMWTHRKSIPLEKPPTIQELIGMVLEAGKADGWQVPVG